MACRTGKLRHPDWGLEHCLTTGALDVHIVAANTKQMSSIKKRGGESRKKEKRGGEAPLAFFLVAELLGWQLLLNYYDY